jgi:hypothetical protein
MYSVIQFFGGPHAPLIRMCHIRKVVLKFDFLPIGFHQRFHFLPYDLWYNVVYRNCGDNQQFSWNLLLGNSQVNMMFNGSTWVYLCPYMWNM